MPAHAIGPPGVNHEAEHGILLHNEEATNPALCLLSSHVKTNTMQLMQECELCPFWSLADRVPVRVTLQDPLIDVKGQFLIIFHEKRPRIADENAGFLRDQVADFLWRETTASDSKPRRIVRTQRRSSVHRTKVIGAQHLSVSGIGGGMPPSPQVAGQVKLVNCEAMCVKLVRRTLRHERRRSCRRKYVHGEPELLHGSRKERRAHLSSPTACRSRAQSPSP